ncbi:dATP/dGTP pyrophosphohydrolase domain-containing protein [Salmonella enterica]
MNNKLTDERPNDESLEILITTRREIAERHASEGRMGQCAVHTLILNALLELQERRKADSAEPVYQYRIRNGYNGQVTEWQTIRRDQVDFVLKAQPLNAELRIIAAPPASEREQIRREHAEWSESTFGNVGPVGPLKHLSKEALEAAAEPGDLSEWADMQFLLWDAQRRAGITDEQITRAMVEKLAVNKKREWPEPKDGEPRLHIKEQPAPVVPEECPAELPYAQVKAAADLYALCWQSGEVVTYTPDPEKATIWLNNYSGTCVQEYVKLERFQGVASDNSPVIPDDWISCSERMPAQDDWVLIYSKHGEYLAGQVQGEYVELNDGTLSWLGSALHWMLLPEPPQEVK